MYARVTTLQGSTENVAEEARAGRETALPALRRMSGFKGWVGLLDRETGRAIGIALWESEEALRKSEEIGTTIRQSAAAGMRSRITGVERFEVTAFLVEADPVEPLR